MKKENQRKQELKRLVLQIAIEKGYVHNKYDKIKYYIDKDRYTVTIISGGVEYNDCLACFKLIKPDLKETHIVITYNDAIKFERKLKLSQIGANTKQ